MSLYKCKYVDFMQDARMVSNAMIVLFYDNTDVMKTQRSQWLDYGLSEFTYSFDLMETYKYLTTQFLLAANRPTRDNLFTDMKMYASTYRKFTDKWFTYFVDGWGGESDDFKAPDNVLKTVFIENINMLTQLADKMVFVYKLLNSYPVNVDDEIDANNAVRYICGKLDEPNSSVMFPIPISVIRFVSTMDYYKTNFESLYGAYKARYQSVYKPIGKYFECN
ncbi:hypothetical protein F-liban_23 [Faustovirus]|nr:hypothetical protein F-liban_23 [Faustovirus]SME64688.1 Hypothetical protein FSTVST1_22 [Faustovirus ST1]